MAVLVNGESIATAFKAPVAPELADLVDLATYAYAADRFCRRGTGSLGWARRIDLRVPMRVPGVWEANKEKVLELLQYLTGDTWALELSQFRSPLRSFEAQGSLFPEPAPVGSTAVLFSGGLDSLAGLASLLRTDTASRLYPVSIRTGTRLGAHQDRCLEAVVAKYPGRIQPIRVSVNFKRGIAGGFNGEERTQRARGFLFQAIGAASAVSGGIETLVVPENGVGALNLPYLSGQIGTQAGRAANPRFVDRVTDLVRAISRSRFTVVLPHLFRTKGELLNELRVAGFEQVIRDTISCDHPFARVSGGDHCGRCTSCLLRRQSLAAAGLSAIEPAARYRDDVRAFRRDSTATHWTGLLAMNHQVGRLRVALAQPEPHLAIAREFPSFLDHLGPIEARASGTAVTELLGMYRRYCEEWRGFAVSLGGESLPAGSARG